MVEMNGMKIREGSGYINAVVMECSESYNKATTSKTLNAGCRRGSCRHLVEPSANIVSFVTLLFYQIMKTQ